jgi:hypothetical protein
VSKRRLTTYRPLPFYLRQSSIWTASQHHPITVCTSIFAKLTAHVPAAFTTAYPAIASTVTATSVYSRPSNSSSSTLSSTDYAPLNLQQRHTAAADCGRCWDQWTPCQAASRAWDVRVFSQHMAASRRRAGGAVLHGVIDINSENLAGLGLPGPSPSSLCEKGTRAVNRRGVSICHLSPKIRVSIVYP